MADSNDQDTQYGVLDVADDPIVAHTAPPDAPFA
jgi:hypothetical protein